MDGQGTKFSRNIAENLNRLSCAVSTVAMEDSRFFRDHPSELVPEENFWTLWCKGRLAEADIPTIRLGATPSGLTSAHASTITRYFLQAGCQ